MNKNICQYCNTEFKSVAHRVRHQRDCPEYLKIKEEAYTNWKSSKHYCSVCGIEITEFNFYDQRDICTNHQCRMAAKTYSGGYNSPLGSKESKDKFRLTKRNKLYDTYIKALQNKNIQPLFDKDYYINRKDGVTEFKFKFKCLTCGHEFSSKYHIHSMIKCPNKDIHNLDQSTLITCEYCGRKFKSPLSCASHKKNCQEAINDRNKSELEWRKSRHYCKYCNTEIIEYEHNDPVDVCKDNLCRNKLETERRKIATKINANDENVKLKRKDTCLEKYGYEFAFQSEEVKQKIRGTMYDKYNGKHSTQDEEVKAKIKATNLAKHGVEYPMQSKEIQAKSKETCFKRCGYESPLQDPESFKKYKRTLRVNHYETFLEFLEKNKLEALFNKEYYISHYMDGENNNYKYKCLRCGEEFISYESAATSVRCERCLKSHISIPEHEIREFILSLGISDEDIICNKRNLYTEDNNIPKEIDINLPKYNLAIEMDGLYWHSDYPSNYHLNKTKACEKLGIQLLHITDSEWDNKREICQSIIKQYLGMSKNKIYARECEIIEVKENDYKEFCRVNHIQGYAIAKTRLGLLHQDKIVHICSFGNSRFKDSETELIRSCSLLNTNVVGGLSKLVSHYVREYKPEELVTYCDRRFFNGKSYLSTGWQLLGETRPNYWYFSIANYYLQSRIVFQKHKLKSILKEFDPNLTEYENMLLNGYLRYYDCGSLKFRYIGK